MTKRTIVFVAAILAVASIASATGVTVIPTLGTDAANYGQAITSDGRYVVGTSSTTTGYVYDTTTGNSVGILNTNDGVNLRRAGATSGVGYRTTSTGVNQLVVHGAAGGVGALWALNLSAQPTSGEWTNTVASEFWSLSPAESTGFNTGVYNNLAMKGLGYDIGYATSRLASSGANKLKTMAFSKLQGGVKSQTNVIASGGLGGSTTVSYTGIGGMVAPGSRAATAVFTATAPTLQGTAPNGITGMAADGSRAFGFKGGATPYAVDMNSSGTFGTEYAMTVIAGSTSTSTAYGSTVNGQYAVGTNYTTTDRAVLWDLTNTANISVLDLTQWATDNSVLGGFTLLKKATSIGVKTNGDFVITGFGTYGGADRAFVLTIPEPATLIFLGLGGLFLRRRRTA